MININYNNKYNKYKIKYLIKGGVSKPKNKKYFVVGYYNVETSLYINLLFIVSV